MSESYFFPYHFAADSLQLAFNNVAIDGNDIGGEFVDPDHHSITLTSITEAWNEIILSVTVSDPNTQLGNVLPDENLITAVQIWLILRNRYTRIRKSIKLARNDSGWEGNISVPRPDISHTTELEAIACLGSELEPQTGYAYKQHEMLGRSSSWKLYTDIVPPMPGSALNSSWLNFSEAENPEIKKRADCVWYLDLNDAESPELFLNEGVPKLRQTLEIESKTSKPARVRDSLIHSILQGVINEMAVYVLANASGSNALEELPDWQRKMLLTLARRDDSASEELVAERWLESWADPGQTAAVLTEISTSVQRHLNLYHSSQYLVRSVEKEIDDD